MSVFLLIDFNELFNFNYLQILIHAEGDPVGEELFNDGLSPEQIN